MLEDLDKPTLRLYLWVAIMGSLVRHSIHFHFFRLSIAYVEFILEYLIGVGLEGREPKDSEALQIYDCVS